MIRYCPVHIYNKYKTNKYRVGFFISYNDKYYFIYNIDMYKGKNKSNIDINPYLHKPPTTQKYVYNVRLKIGIANDNDGSRHLYIDNLYYVQYTV